VVPSELNKEARCVTHDQAGWVILGDRPGAYRAPGARGSPRGGRRETFITELGEGRER